MFNSALLEAIAVVSADPDVQLGIRQLAPEGLARSTMLFRSGAELMRFLEDGRVPGRYIAIVDTHVADIAPLNLVDAVRRTAPDVGLVVVLDNASETLVQRAMLAGARAAVRKNSSISDMRTAVERVVSVHSDERAPNYPAATRQGNGPDAPVLAVIGARGGAGRSTVSSLLAHLAAAAGVDTALVDLDLQFGDLSFLHGISSPAADSGCDATLSADAEVGALLGSAFKVADRLTLYSASGRSNLVEHAANHLSSSIGQLSANHSFVVLNTGAFWTLFHAELLSVSDQVACVLDQSVAGVRATMRMVALCERLGISTVGFEYIVNRWVPEGVSAREVSRALGVELVRTIPDGGLEARVGIDGGSIQRVALGESEIAEAARLVLEDIAARAGLSILRKPAGRGLARRARLLRGARS